MKRDFLLWLTILAGPAAWFLNMEASFALVPLVCQWHSGFVPGLTAAIALAIVAASGLLARYEWQRLEVHSGDPQPAEPRPRAMALGGMLLSGLFFVVILAQTIPTLELELCQ